MCYSEFTDIIRAIDDMDADVIDVYKRQVLEEKQFREQVYAAVMKLPEKQAKRIYARYYLGTVSYTHLDVYKRQV